MDDKREARAEGGRRFQREGPITEKDLDMAMVVLVRGTKSSPFPGSVEDEAMRQRSGIVTAFARYLKDEIFSYRHFVRTTMHHPEHTCILYNKIMFKYAVLFDRGPAESAHAV